MNNLSSSILASAILLLGGTSVKADWDFWALKDGTVNGIWGIHIYQCDSGEGTCELKKSKSVDSTNNNMYTKSYIDDENNLIFYDADNNVYKYNSESNEVTDISDFASNYEKTLSRKNVIKNQDGSVKIGIGNKSLDVDTDGININGDSVITKNTDVNLAMLKVTRNLYICNSKHCRIESQIFDSIEKHLPHFISNKSSNSFNPSTLSHNSKKR